MTPRMLYALRKRHIEQMQREEIMFGNIAAVAANFSFSPPKEPLTSRDFMMHPIRQLPPTPEQSGEEVLSVLRSLPAGAAIEVEKS